MSLRSRIAGEAISTMNQIASLEDSFAMTGTTFFDQTQQLLEKLN